MSTSLSTDPDLLPLCDGIFAHVLSSLPSSYNDSTIIKATDSISGLLGSSHTILSKIYIHMKQQYQLTLCKMLQQDPKKRFIFHGGKKGYQMCTIQLNQNHHNHNNNNNNNNNKHESKSVSATTSLSRSASNQYISTNIDTFFSSTSLFQLLCQSIHTLSPSNLPLKLSGLGTALRQSGKLPSHITDQKGWLIKWIQAYPKVFQLGKQDGVPTVEMISQSNQQTKSTNNTSTSTSSSSSTSTSTTSTTIDTFLSSPLVFQLLCDTITSLSSSHIPLKLSILGTTLRDSGKIPSHIMDKKGWLTKWIEAYPQRFQLSKINGGQIVEMISQSNQQTKSTNNTLTSTTIPTKPPISIVKNKSDTPMSSSPSSPHASIPIIPPRKSISPPPSSGTVVATSSSSISSLHKPFLDNNDYRIFVLSSLSECKYALDIIRTHQYIAIDCEGVNLGRTGRLCLIQIAVPSNNGGKKTDVYIFDMMAFRFPMDDDNDNDNDDNDDPHDSRPMVEDLCILGLRHILQYTNILKIMHDCRCDYDALLHQLGITLHNVFDTQAALSVIEGSPHHIIKRSSLNLVLQRYATHINHYKDNHKDMISHDFTIWRKRPISSTLLSYAAMDVVYLLQAYNNMKYIIAERMDIVMKLSQTQMDNREEHEEDEENMEEKQHHENHHHHSNAVHHHSHANGIHHQRDAPPSTPHILYFTSAHQPIIGPPLPSSSSEFQSLHSSYEMHMIWEPPPHDHDAEMRILYDILPSPLDDRIRKVGDEHIIDIVLDLGRNVSIYANTTEDDNKNNTYFHLPNTYVTHDTLHHITQHIGTINTDNRAGLKNTLHRISAIRTREQEIAGFTIRIGRAIYGTVDIIQDYVIQQRQNILLVGAPGVGKTAILREMARVLSDYQSQRVMVIDTSNEIAGDDIIPHHSIGSARRMQVRTPSQQHHIMLEAVQNHTPQVIIIDEISNGDEVNSVKTIAQRGVRLIASAHGSYLSDILKNPVLCPLIGGVQSVILSDAEAHKRNCSKSALQRMNTPIFNIVIEIGNRHEFIIDRITVAVDDMLQQASTVPTSKTRRNKSPYMAERRTMVLDGHRQYVSTCGVIPTNAMIQP